MIGLRNVRSAALTRKACVCPLCFGIAQPRTVSITTIIRYSPLAALICNHLSLHFSRHLTPQVLREGGKVIRTRPGEKDTSANWLRTGLSTTNYFGFFSS